MIGVVIVIEAATVYFLLVVLWASPPKGLAGALLQQVRIVKASGDLYAAVIDDKVAMKIGPGDWSPNSA